MKKLLIIIVTTFVFSTLKATTPTWLIGRTISKIYPLSNGNVVVMFKESSPSCTNAGNPKYHYLAVGENNISQEGLERIYSALLTAAAANKKVTINFDSDSSACYINRASVDFN